MAIHYVRLKRIVCILALKPVSNPFWIIGNDAMLAVCD
jgi:hypothetical protein